MVEDYPFPNICAACRKTLFAQIRKHTSSVYGYCSHRHSAGASEVELDFVTLVVIAVREGSIHRISLKGWMPENEAIEAIAKGHAVGEQIAEVLQKRKDSLQ